MPFLRNEFTKTFEDFFTLTQSTEMTNIFDPTEKLKLKQKI